jgi:hypothetical protein
MIFRQYLAINPVAAFYLFGCGGGGVAAVVDPVGDLDRYLCDADKTRADEPWLAFTGHTLMVGDLAVRNWPVALRKVRAPCFNPRVV